MAHCGWGAKALCALSCLLVVYALYLAWQVFSADYGSELWEGDPGETSFTTAAILTNYLMAPKDQSCTSVSDGISVTWSCGFDSDCTSGEFASSVTVNPRCDTITGFPSHNVVAEFDAYEKTIGDVTVFPGSYTITSTQPVYYMNEAIALLATGTLYVVAFLAALCPLCGAGCCAIGACISFCSATPPQEPGIQMGQPMQQPM